MLLNSHTSRLKINVLRNLFYLLFTSLTKQNYVKYVNTLGWGTQSILRKCPRLVEDLRKIVWNEIVHNTEGDFFCLELHHTWDLWIFKKFLISVFLNLCLEIWILKNNFFEVLPLNSKILLWINTPLNMYYIFNLKIVIHA